jgi:cell division protein FtsW
MAEASAHTGFRAWYFLVRHALFVGVGVVAAFIAFQVPMKAWQQTRAVAVHRRRGAARTRLSSPGIGKSVNGSRRGCRSASSTCSRPSS